MHLRNKGVHPGRRATAVGAWPDGSQLTIVISAGARGEVIDGRVAFQTATEDEFTPAIKRLTHRRVVAFLSATQTIPAVPCEMFFLDAAPFVSTAGDVT